MSQIVTHSNILNPHGIMVMPTTARHSDDIVKDLLIADGYEVILSKNSIIMDEPFEIVEGDIINVMFVPQGGGGRGKNILGTIAMIAVAVFAPQFAMSTGVFGAEGALAGYGLGLTGFTGSLVAGGIMLAGSLLVNAVFGAAIPTSSLNNDTFSNSVTYSWDESYNQFKQGIPIPKIFGTHKITPPLISKYIETIDNKQYFNGLYAVNDGLISNLTDIKINDESIDNFDNVTIQVRNGANIQGIISNFDNTFSDRSVNKKLSTSWADTETTGNQVTGLNVVLVFPRGIFYANDKGGLSTHSVKVVLEYSSDNVNWTRFGGDTTITGYWYYVDWEGDISQWDNYNGKYITSVSRLPADAIRYGNNVWNQWYYTPTYTVPYTTISGAETSTIRKTFKLNYLAPSKYYVRARFYEEPPTTSRYGSDCYLEYITEEVGDDFTYPNTALISVRALATDQLSGVNPKISCIVSANSSNPALICKQMLLEAGISSDRILPSFKEWEAHCNAMGYACNIVFDASMNLRKALDIVSTLGRASVVQFGSKFEVIMDRAEAIPVQSFTFGMGNILKDSFKQQFLPILDRANVIEITYYDANLDYDATIVEVSNTNYDSVAEENRTAVTLVGCTSRTQAIKHARYMLNCNRYLTEIITLEADKDSLVCKYGDIVRVSHDVPQYGFSGRIISCTTTSITLDREIPIIYGVSYYVQIRDINNNVYEHPVHWKATGDYDTFDFVTPISTPYSQYDNYAFGEIGKASKLYRVLKIGTSSDLTRTLSLLEYNEDVYNDEGDIDVPQISALGLSSLRATDYIRYAKDGSIETVMQLAWNGQGLFYTVQYAQAGGAYTSVKVNDSMVDIVVNDVTYNIIVTDNFGNSASLTYAVQGKKTPPDAVTNLQCTESGNVFSLSWEYKYKPVDFREFIILYNNLEIGRTKTNSFSYFSQGLEPKTFTVVAQDTSGNNSDFISVVATAQKPDAVTNLQCTESGNVFSLSWEYKYKPVDFKTFVIHMNGAYIGSTVDNSFNHLSLGLDTKTFTVYVVDTSYNYSNSVSINYTAKAPADISNLRCTESGNTFNLTWSYVKPDDFKEFIVFMNDVFIGSTVNTNYSYFSRGLDTKTFTVYVVDVAENYSEAVNIYITAQAPADVSSFRVDNAFSTLKTLRWEYTKPNDFDSFEIRLLGAGMSKWEDGISIGSGKITNSPFLFNYDGKTDYTLMIKAIDTGGNYSTTPAKAVFNLGDLDTSNIVLTSDFATLWNGTITNGQVISGHLKTLQDTTSMYVKTPMYSNLKNKFFSSGVYSKNQFYNGYGSLYGKNIPLLTYMQDTTITATGLVKILQDIEGDYRIYYNIIGDDYLYDEGNKKIYGSGNFYKNYQNFVEYTGSFQITKGKTIQWMIKTFGGAIDASKFSVIIDVPDIYDYINDYTVPVGGKIIPPNKTFQQIKNVITTIQGSNGVVSKVISKTQSGAFIKVYDANGNDVGGVLDVQYKGY